MVEQYTANTHAATHNQYKLKVRSVLKAERAGEASAHQESLGNRQLLWHGSRLTNWVGILSQGLRIAPPEAPATGYMFGKGARATTLGRSQHGAHLPDHTIAHDHHSFPYAHLPLHTHTLNPPSRSRRPLAPSLTRPTRRPMLLHVRLESDSHMSVRFARLASGVYFADMVRRRRSFPPHPHPSRCAIDGAVPHLHPPTHPSSCLRPSPQVSKSANYCAGSRESPTAVLLLCDVALGDQYELIASQYEAAEKSAAQGKNSTWGIGKTRPDPEGGAATAEGVRVPMGKAVANSYLSENVDQLVANGAGKRSELLYNEFIVYDVAQIRMKYVVVMDMSFDD